MPQAVAAAVVELFALTGTAATIVSAAVEVAIYAGVAAVTKQNSKTKDQGGLINLELNPSAPRRLIVGKRLIGGNLVDWYVAGTKNTKLYLPIYLTEGPAGTITRVFAGGRVVWDTPLVHGVRTTIPDFRSGGDRLWLTYYDGRVGQTADPALVALGQGWTTDNKMTGCAYVVAEMQWDSDNMRSPVQLIFEHEGAKFYDRRKDTTAGGSGSHRLNDPSTWELGDAEGANPAVALDHYQLGRYWSGQRVFGIGMAPSDVPYDRFAAQANICDENVDLKAGGTQKRYRANGVISAEDQYDDTIRALCKAMAAEPADFGGRVGVVGIEAKTAVLVIDDDDLIDGAGETFTPKRSWGELVGAVEGKYQDPTQLYQPVPYAEATDAAWSTQDGGEPKRITHDLEFETNGERAQRLAMLKAKYERRQATLNGLYPFWAIELERGDWFLRTGRAGSRFGEAGKLFEVMDRILDPKTFLVAIPAKEVDATDSAWDETAAVDPPPAPTAGTATLSSVEVPAITVTAITLAGTASSVPAMKITFTSPTDPRIKWLYIEVENVDGVTPKVTKTVTIPADANEVVFSDGIVDGDGYAVSAKYITDTLQSAWCVASVVYSSGTYAVGTASAVPWTGVTSRPANLSALGGSEPIKNELVAMGPNSLRNAEYRITGGYYFTQGTSTAAPTASYADSNGLRRATLTSTGSVPNGASVNLAGGGSNRIPCVAGDRIEASAYLGAAASGWTHGQVNVFWYDTAGAFLSNSVAAASTSLSGKDGSGSIATFQRLGGFVTAPTSAVAFTIVCVFTNSSGSAITSPVGHITQPFSRKADANQTALSPWAPGFEATLAADITSANTAAGITGQGAFATLNSAAYGSSLLTGFAALAAKATIDSSALVGSNVIVFTALASTAVRLGTNITRNDGTTSLTDALAVTALGTAAAFTGQGALATLSSLAYGGAYLSGFAALAAKATIDSSALVGSGVIVYTALSSTAVRLGTNITRADGSTSLTDSLAVTSLGTAAAIASQGALATLSQVALGASGRVYRDDGTTRLTDSLAVTSLGTAAAIASQGWGATASQANADNAYVPIGENLIVNSDWARDLTGWYVSGTTNSGQTPQSGFCDTDSVGGTPTSYSGSIRTRYTLIPGTMTGGQYVDGISTKTYASLTDLKRYGVRVNGGERLHVSTYMSAHRGQAQLLMVEFDATGAAVGAALSWTGTSNHGGAGGGEPSAMERLGGFVTTQSTTRYLMLIHRLLGNGGNNPYLFSGWAMVAKVSSTQTVAPTYKSGRTEPYSDTTVENTAAAFTGQGALATLSSLAYGGAYLSGFAALAAKATIDSSALVGSGVIVYTALSSTAVRLGTNITRADGSTSLTDALAVTSLGTAAAITGQGWGATASQASADNGYVPGEGNQQLDPAFDFGVSYYGEADTNTGLTAAKTTGTTGTSGLAVKYLQHAFTGTPSSGLYFCMGLNGAYGMPVSGGERVEFQTLISADSCGYAYLQCMAVDASTAAILPPCYDQVGPNVTPVATSAPVGANGWSKLSGFVDLPAGVRSVWFRVVFVTNGGANPKGRIARPLLRIANPGQTQASPWSPGRGQPGADVTASNTAAAFTGQGALATLSSLAYGGAYLSGFGTVAALSSITGLTAGAITGQGGLATLSWVTINSNLRLADGTTVATTAMVVTASGTAAAIAGQGWGATASQANADNAYNPIGENLIVNSDWAKDLTGWYVSHSTNSALSWTSGFSDLDGIGAYSGAIRTRYTRNPAGGTLPSGQYVDGIVTKTYGSLADLKRYAVRVNGGDRMHASMYMSAHRAQAQLILVEFDDTGAAVGSALSWTGTANHGGFNGGNPNNAERLGGFFTAQSTTRYVLLICRLLGTGGADPYLFSGWPMIAKVGATQTVAPAYKSGQDDRYTDYTNENTAAAIISQGWGATASEAAARATRGRGLMRNATFEEYFTGTALPPGWSNWSNGTGTFIAKPFGDGNCFSQVGGAAAETGVNQQTLGIQPNTQYLLTGTVRRQSGSLAGCGVYVEWYSSTDTYIATAQPIAFANSPTTAGLTNATPDGVHRWEKLVTSPAGAVKAVVYAMTHWSGHGSIAAANSIAWLEADLIPMSLVAQLRADVTNSNTAAAISGQGSLATANYYYQSTDPGAVANGSQWADTTSKFLKIRDGGVWKNIGFFGELTATVTGNYSASHSAAGTMTQTPSVTPSGGSGSYTYYWTVDDLIYGATPTLTNRTSATVTVTKTFGNTLSISGVLNCMITDTVTGRITNKKWGYEDLATGSGDGSGGLPP